MAIYKLTDFDAVLAISRRGTFRAAALDMGMSTSALSNAIANLEEQLGVRLFNRTTRSVSLTDAGRRFVDQVSPALRDIHQALDMVRSQQETPSGTLRINTFATAGREILSPLILEFLRRFPEVRVDVVTEGNLVDIVADGFDFGVRSQPLVPSDMIAIPIGPITLDEASLARIAVLESVGIGYFMESDVWADIEAGRLVRVLDEWTPPLSPLFLYYPSRQNPPAAFKVFVDLARELARSVRGRCAYES